MGRHELVGVITSAGFAGGDRFVVGAWERSPIGPFSDVMWAGPDGRRRLLVPSEEAGAFVAAVYRFDAVDVVPFAHQLGPAQLDVEAGDLRLHLTAGGGWRIPFPGLRSPAVTRWVEAPVARALLGVRTFGTTPTGVREWYRADEYRPVVEGRATVAGRDLGPLRCTWDPAAFGFSEPPRRAAMVRVRPLLDDPAGALDRVLPGPAGAGGQAHPVPVPGPGTGRNPPRSGTQKDGPAVEAPRPSPLDGLAWPLRTERLTIRRGTVGDLEATWRFRRLEAVSRWVTTAPATLEDYRSQYERPDRLAKTLVVELDGEVVGELMVAVEDGWAQAEVAEQARDVQAELGWVLHPERAGLGYATEAVRALIRLCFEDLGLRRVTAHCFAGNEASWRLMERVGMRREAHFVRDSLHRSGAWLDGFSYALLAEEWGGPVAAGGEGH